uniref:Uncharacterized protein n=1 Tax=Coccolithus braarudii TaxID=221442 RepID=A0A7S0Q4Q7_9EUKA
MSASDEDVTAYTGLSLVVASLASVYAWRQTSPRKNAPPHDKTDQLTAVNNQLAMLAKQLAASNDRADRAEAQRAKAEKQLNELQARCELADQQAREAREKIEKLEEQIQTERERSLSAADSVLNSPHQCSPYLCSPANYSTPGSDYCSPGTRIY